MATSPCAVCSEAMYSGVTPSEVYRMLGVYPDVVLDLHKFRRAYKRCAMLIHPDKLDQTGRTAPPNANFNILTSLYNDIEDWRMSEDATDNARVANFIRDLADLGGCAACYTPLWHQESFANWTPPAAHAHSHSMRAQPTSPTPHHAADEEDRVEMPSSEDGASVESSPDNGTPSRPQEPSARVKVPQQPGSYTDTEEEEEDNDAATSSSPRCRQSGSDSVGEPSVTDTSSCTGEQYYRDVPRRSKRVLTPSQLYDHDPKKRRLSKESRSPLLTTPSTPRDRSPLFWRQYRRSSSRWDAPESLAGAGSTAHARRFGRSPHLDADLSTNGEEMDSDNSDNSDDFDCGDIESGDNEDSDVDDVRPPRGTRTFGTARGSGGHATWVTRAAPIAAPTAPFNANPPPSFTQFDIRTSRVPPLSLPLETPDTTMVNNQPQPRYGPLAQGETTATFRYSRSFLHLRAVGIMSSKKRGAVVVGVIRRPDVVWEDHFPEYIVVATFNPTNGLVYYRVKNMDIEGNNLDQWNPMNKVTAVDIEAVLIRGYLFPEFARLLKTGRDTLIASLQVSDQPPL